jgi:cytochrome c-type biogenesis protein CcmH/NrfG
MTRESTLMPWLQPDAMHGAWPQASSGRAWASLADDPWRASIWARGVLASERDDDIPWAVLGLAQSLMGHHHYAVAAYRQARRRAPDNPWYAHNLGHLLDVACDRPAASLPLLAHAYRSLGDRREIVTSYAHALWRCDHLEPARRLMLPIVRGQATPAEHDLYAAILVQHEDAVQAQMKLQLSQHDPTSEPPARRVLRRRSTR